MVIENSFPSGQPRYVTVPRALEADTYVWPEYARGAESEERTGEAPKFVAGDMYFVRFGPHNGDPIWTLDILGAQTMRDPEILGYVFPFYPLCLQKAPEFAQIVDFDLDIPQDEILQAVRDLLPDGLRLQADPVARRYARISFRATRWWASSGALLRAASNSTRT